MFLAPVALAVVLSTTDAAVIDATFARWEDAARALKSLHVEYTSKVDTDWNKQQATTNCTLRLLRTDAGVVGDLTTAGDHSQRYVLGDGAVYRVYAKEKTAVRYCDGDPTGWVQRYYLPFLAVLDREKTEKWYSVALQGRNDWFVFLRLTAKDTHGGLTSGNVAIPHRKNDKVPVGMPFTVIASEQFSRIRWDVSKWVMNGDDPPKAEEFELPTAKGGWKITDSKDLPRWGSR